MHKYPNGGWCRRHTVQSVNSLVRRARPILSAFFDFSQAKINQINLPIGSEFDIGRLDITVDDRAGLTTGWIASIVQAVQRTHDRRDPLQHACFRQRAALILKQLPEVFALDILHDQELLTIRFDKIIGDER